MLFLSAAMRRSPVCLAAVLCLLPAVLLAGGLRVTSVKVYTPPSSAIKKGDVVIGGALALAGVEVRDGTAAMPPGGGVRLLTPALAENITASFSACCSALPGAVSFRVAQSVVRGRRAEVTVVFGGELSALYAFGPHERAAAGSYGAEKLYYALPPGGFAVTDPRLASSVMAEVERAGRAALKAEGIPLTGK